MDGELHSALVKEKRRVCTSTLSVASSHAWSECVCVCVNY